MTSSYSRGKRNKKKVQFQNNTQVPSYNRDESEPHQVTINCGNTNQQKEEIIDFDSSSSIKPSILFKN